MQHDHDALFRFAFEQPEHAASLLAAILPRALGQAIDWSSLVVEPGSVVDEGLRASHADLLFTAQLHRQRVLLYLLLEHKSTDDRWTAWQLLRYVVRTLERHRAAHPELERLPPIVPIVVHHGDRTWTAPRCALDLFAIDDLPPGIARPLAALQPNAALDRASAQARAARGRHRGPRWEHL